MKQDSDTKAFNASWSYEAAPESKDHIQLKEQYELFINGEFIPPTKGKYFETINPADHQVISKIAEASAEDVDKCGRRCRKSI